MLEAVRRSARSGLSYIMVAGLIVIFAFFFGVPADGCSSGPNAARNVATVAGDKVSSDDINIVYNRVYGTRRQGDEAQIQRQQAQALKAYLIIELLAHKARESGLRVDEEEFRSFMQDPLRNPEYASVYGRSGSWDGDFYKRYVQNLLHANLPQYEDFKRDELLARKYMNLVEMQVGVIPQEVSALEKVRNTKLDLEFVKFSPDALAEHVEVTDDEVASFLADNKDRVEAFYEENLSEYSEPAKMEVRRIYLERGQQGPEGASAQERFEEAKERLGQGEDFAAVAGEINDALKEQQGLMEMTSVENMNQEIVQALSDAEAGDVREVETDTELMLVELVEKQEAVETPLAELQDDIARELLQQEKVDTLISDMSEELLARAEQASSLSAALDALRPADDEPAEGEEQADDEPQDKSVWASVEVRETGEFTLEGEDMSSMFGGQLPPGVSLGRSPWDRIPEIGQSRSLAVDAFTKLSEEDPLAEQAYEVDDSKVVVRLKSKTTPEADEEQVADVDLELNEELRNQKLGELLGNWQMVFLRPSFEYGPYLENLYEKAIETGVIELKENAHPMAALIAPGAMEETQGGTPGQGSPIELSPNGEAPEGGGPPAQ